MQYLHLGRNLVHITDVVAKMLLHDH